MANVYNLEPPPTAKVLLHTTAGDIALELFASQTPLTSRNFLQHCLDEYYTNTIFHRLVPGFILQGGDPTGTGHGGESSYEHGKPFADEFHSRLKFNRRGLLGMANGGAKDDNGSQFFLTLGKAEELNGKHTMFGRVEAEGNTVFNLVKMGEADLVEEEGGSSERPLYPTRITGTEVLVNPFKDMVKRDRVATRVTSARTETKKKEKGGKKKGGKGLLSFAGGEEEGEDVVAVKLANPKLINTVKEEEKTSAKRPAPPSAVERAPKRRAASPTPPPPPTQMTSQQAPPKANPLQPSPSPSPSPSRSPSPPPQSRSETLLQQANAQIAALKASLKREIPTTTNNTSKPKSALEAMIPATATRGRRRKGGNSSAPTREEQRALDEFNAFRRKLETTAPSEPPPAPSKIEEAAEKPLQFEKTAPTRPTTSAPAPAFAPAPAEDDDEAALCDLHFVANCQSCKRWDEDDGANSTNNKDGPEDDDAGWLSHRLTFEKDRLGKDLKWKEQNEKELVVIDPRERERELGVKKGGKGRRDERGGVRKETEWDRRARDGGGVPVKEGGR